MLCRLSFTFVCEPHAPVILHLHGWDVAMISDAQAMVSSRMALSLSLSHSSVCMPFFNLSLHILINTEHLKSLRIYSIRCYATNKYNKKLIVLYLINGVVVKLPQISLFCTHMCLRQILDIEKDSLLHFVEC